VDDPYGLDGDLAPLLALRGPLALRLAAYTARLASEAPSFHAAYDSLVERLRAGRTAAGAPVVGDRMPPFALPDPDGRLHWSDALTRDGPLVVSFNRGGWCPYCRIEIDALSAAAPSVTALGGRLVSIVPDRAAYAGGLSRRTDPALTILTDAGCGYALTVGLVLYLGPALLRLMTEDGIDLADVQGTDSGLTPLPATFVLARGGRVVARHVDPDFRTRMDPQAIVSAVAAAA
jgi:peroxiredoxin